MAELITAEISIGVTSEMKSRLELACAAQGIKWSTFGRQALLEKLVRDNWMEHPAAKFVNSSPAAGAKKTA